MAAALEAEKRKLAGGRLSQGEIALGCLGEKFNGACARGLLCALPHCCGAFLKDIHALYSPGALLQGIFFYELFSRGGNTLNIG
jgi:hypothetical protein